MAALPDRFQSSAPLWLDLAVIVFVVWGLRVAFRWFRNPSSLATLYQVRELTPKHAARTATRLRGLVEGHQAQGVPAARPRACCWGTTCRPASSCAESDEDTYVAIMAPRAGKSTSLAIPVAEEARAPC